VKIEMIAATVALVVSIASGSVAIENRYALDADLLDLEYATNMYHVESEIQRAQDRLEGLLNIPVDERRQWMEREIDRLVNLIDRLVRQLETLRG